MVSDKAKALATAWSNLTELKAYFDHRFQQLLWAKGVKYDDYVLSDVTGEDGGIILKTEYYCHGDTDCDEHFFPLTDLDVDIEELNRRENARLEKERIATEARQKADKAAYVARAEAHDRSELKRLTEKYGLVVSLK